MGAGDVMGSPEGDTEQDAAKGSRPPGNYHKDIVHPQHLETAQRRGKTQWNRAWPGTTGIWAAYRSNAL